MTSAVPALAAALLADTAGLGALVGTRIYSFEAPEADILPDLVIYPVSAMPTGQMAGMLPPFFERVCVESRSDRFSIADRVATAADLVLGNRQFLADGVMIDGCLNISTVWLFDRDFRIYRCTVDYRVSYRPV